ncbi:hypothetical protein [Plasmodium yoelii yoelii]|uniref:Uncharacterized protein n=1 Tax=Plasmodium yoelii yoelii TaxID=73239 RepID=Q7RQM1_PLAYO|nr:hypothetical protein [Plasmodium yoelii yoelii]
MKNKNKYDYLLKLLLVGDSSVVANLFPTTLLLFSTILLLFSTILFTDWAMVYSYCLSKLALLQFYNFIYISQFCTYIHLFSIFMVIGKSSILCRYSDNQFEEKVLSTIGLAPKKEKSIFNVMTKYATPSGFPYFASEIDNIWTHLAIHSSIYSFT